MSINNLLLMIGVMSLTVSCAMINPKKNWTLTSPDGNIRLAVERTHDLKQKELSVLEQASLLYKVDYRISGKWIELIGLSPLGIQRTDQDFTNGLKFQSGGKKRSIQESYTMLTGKRRFCQNTGNEMTLNFRNSDSAKIQFVFRAYNNGVAFQYRFPDSSTESKTVLRETTGFRMPPNGFAYIQPYEQAGKYKPSYEAFYRNRIPVGTASPDSNGWAFPALFALADHSAWILLTEAGLDTTYCGSHLDGQAPNGLYTIRFPETGEGWNTGTVEPSSTLPWATPWRVIEIGKTPAGIVESTLVTDVSPPSRIEKTDWIRPGRVSWSWWSDNNSPTDAAKLRKFVDLSGNMGWEYSLVDANWNKMPPETIPSLVQYAAERNVGILLWYNSGGLHNIVTEQPRDRMRERTIRRREFAWLQEIGVKGVKVDFFMSDKQDIIRLYVGILEDAADFGLMVNFHGCTIPRGWARTYPHLMTMEGVRGAESYIFDPLYPDSSYWHNTILACTRNAVGSMDYTPVTFSKISYPHRTTNGHELALSVVFESGWTHFADRAEAYLNLPPAPKDFLKQIPTVWDDTRFLFGEPGKLVVIARKNEGKWYIGGINGENQTAKPVMKLNFLDAVPYTMRVINDDGLEKGFIDWQVKVTAADSLTVPIQPYGGFVVELEPES